MAVTPTPGALGPTSTPAQAGGANAGAPANAVTPCCWCDTFVKKVSEHGSIWVLSTQHTNFPIKFTMTVDLAGNEVVIEVKFKWNTVYAAVTAAQKAAVQTGMTSIAASAWSGKYGVKVVDPACTPPTKTLAIRFVASFVTSGEDILVDLLPGPGTSSVGLGLMTLHATDTVDAGYVFIHEFGHTFGLDDEYFYPGNTTGSVAYKRANGTTTTITLPQNDNVMSTYGDMNLKPRFFYFVEIEAQKLLRSGAGLGRAAITCEIV
ncbi:MAG: M64 family metallopeptidase [Rhodobacteraceae bacterium]|nr:M64 family metallopeptidase [Paracoccaceae bacterium]